MKILDIRPQPGGAARFDAQLTDDIRVFNLKLVGPRWRIHAPSVFGAAAATFSRDLSQQLTRAAVAALEEKTWNDRISA